MPGRKYNSGSAYRYGFNGQENRDEIAAGLTTAMYWEYDSRIGRRWNVDPEFKKYPEESSYLTFHNNPISITDHNGDDPPKNFKKHAGAGGDLFLPQGAVVETFKGPQTNSRTQAPINTKDGTVRAFSIGKQRFVSTFDKNGNFGEYKNFSTGAIYKNPDISVKPGAVLSSNMNVTFSLTNTGSGSSGQAFQIVSTNLPIESAKYKSGGISGFVDGGKYSPGYKQNGNNEVVAGTPFYIGIFQGRSTGKITPNGTGVDVNLHDNPDAQGNINAVVNFQTVIISTNFYGSGQNVVMGVYNWGFTKGGSLAAINNGQTHQTNKIEFTNLTTQSQAILKKDYPAFILNQ